MRRIICSMLLVALIANATSAQYKTYDLVKDFGAKGDNRTDCYNAFSKAAAAISKAGGGTLNIPKGKYYIGAYKINGGPAANNITDIIFKNCRSLIIKGNNSTIRLNGNFTRSKDYMLPGVPYHYAYKNTVAPFQLRNCKGVQLSDMLIDGGVLQMRKTDGVVEGECYGIFITDDNPEDVSSNILVKNVQTNHFAADGILIRSNGENISFINCTSNNNGRQGISIVKGNKISLYNCVFDSTGFTGNYGWHAPGAGIDIENEFGKGRLKNVSITRCSFRSNKGFQIVTTLQSENVTVDSCFIADLTYGYSDGVNGVGMYSLNATLSNSILFANIQVDLADQLYTGPLVQQVRNNIVYSGKRGIISASFSRPVNIVDNIFINLPHPVVNEYFPYIQNFNARFNNNIIVTHADVIKAQPGQVTALVQSVLEANDNAWLANGYTINDAEQRSTYYFPALNGSKVVGNQFFPENNRIAAQGYSFFKLISKKKIDKLLTAPVFTNYKQLGWNRSILEQANAVKKEMKTLMAAVR